MGKLNRISLGLSPFYRELQKIFMDDHPQVTIVVQNLIFYNTITIIIIIIIVVVVVVVIIIIIRKKILGNIFNFSKNIF